MPTGSAARRADEKTLRVFSILVLTNDDAVCFLFFAAAAKHYWMVAASCTSISSSGKNPKHMCFLHLPLRLTLLLFSLKMSHPKEWLLLVSYRYWRRREITSQIPIKMKVALVLGALSGM